MIPSEENKIISTNDISFLSTKHASELSGYHSDYLARLCKSGKIVGKQIGRTWLVSQPSLEEFVKSQENRKQELREQLSEQREKEYQVSVALAGKSIARRVQRLSPILQKFASVKNSEEPSPEIFKRHAAFQKQGVAILAALVVMLIGVGGAEAAEQNSLISQSEHVALATSNGVHEIASNAFTALQGHEENVEAQEALLFVAQKKSEQAATLSAANTKNTDLILADAITTKAAKTSTSVSSKPNTSTENEYTNTPEENNSAPEIEKSISGISFALSHPQTLPRSLGLASVQAYVAIGTSVFTGITNGMNAETNAEYAWIHFSQNILHGYSQGVYAWVNVTPRIPEVAAEGTLALGAFVGDETGALSSGAMQGSRVAIETISEDAPQLSNHIAQQEVAFGEHATRTTSTVLAIERNGIQGFTYNVLGGYRTAQNGIAEGEKESQNSTIALATSSVPTLATLTASVDSFGYVPTHSFGELVAVATYDTITGFFQNIQNQFALFFGGSNTLRVEPTTLVIGSPSLVGSSRPLTGVDSTRSSSYTTTESSSQSSSAQTAPAAGNSSPNIIQTFLEGATQAYVDQGLSDLKAFVIADIEASHSTGGNGGGGGGTTIVNNYSTATSSTDITGTSLSISGSSTLSGPLTAASSTFSGPVVINGDVTINGTLNAPGYSGGSNGVAGSFTATSTNATSTFAGSVDIDNGGLTYATSTRTTSIENADIGNATVTNATFTNATSTNFFATLAQITTGIFSNLTAQLATIVGLNATDSTTTNATSTNLYATNGFFDNLVATIANFTTGMFTNLFATNANLTNANLTNATTTNATSTNLYASNISGATANITSITGTNLSTVNATSTNLITTNLSATSALLTQATSTDFFAALAHIADGTIDTFNSTLATIAGLNVTNSTTTSATSTNLYASNFSTDNANVGALSIGNLNGFLTATNGVVGATSSIDLTTDVTGVLPQANGGTGISTYNPGDILYADAFGNLTTLPVGANGQVLKLQGGLPYWGIDQTVGSGGSDGIFATSSNLIYPLDSSNALILGDNTQSDPNSIFEVHGSSYFSGNIGVGSTSPFYRLSVEGKSSLGSTAIAGYFVATTTATSTLPSLNTQNFELKNYNGPLQANNGWVSATTSIGVLYGGTGLTTAPTYGNLLVGNSNGGYSLTATSSLNIAIADLVGTTDNLTEGSTNLYFTNARAQAAISVSGAPLTYSAGVIGINQATASQDGYLSSVDFNTFNNKIASTSLSGGTGISYNPSTGVIANTGVTSVNASGGTTGLSFSGGPITSSGVLTLAGTLGVPNGGTGSTTLTGLLKGNGTGAIQTAVAGTDYQAPGSYITALTGDVTATGPGLAVATLATVNGNPGSYGSSTAIPTFTVNGKGLITAAGSFPVIAPAGTLSGTTLASNVVTSSLTSLGTLSALTVSGNSSLANTTLTNATSTSLYTSNLGINGQYFTSLTGAGLVDTGGVLSLSSAPFSGTYFAQGGNAYGTTAVLGTTDNNPLTFIVNNSEKARIDTSGHLGLGTTNPLYPLDINAAGQEALFGETGSNDYIGLANNNAYLGYDHFAGDTVLQGASGRGIEFAVNNSTFSLGVAATLTANGYFGIGTSSPANTLAVSGGASIGADYSTAAPTNGLIVEGNTGIGTTAPIAMLDVAGFINTDQYSGYEQGGQLLAYASSTNQDTIFGLGAGGQYATTTSNFSKYSTAIGYKSLSGAGTFTSSDTAVGANALGFGTGSSNTGVGFSALQFNPTGGLNTAIGALALTSATTSAIANQAFGASALFRNTTGSNNTAIGQAALYTQTTASDNIAIGFSAGSHVTTGSGNILIGDASSTATANLTTGYGNISLGNNISLPSATASNQLDIGNEIYGTGLNGTGATLSTGNIGIGTTTPGSLFSIGNTNGINFSTATSTFSSTGGISIANGCYAVNGVCIGTSLTGLSGTLAVSNGGTGSTTLTGLLKGNGTGAIQTAVAGTDYQAPGSYITALTGDVTATGPGSAVTTLATVNANTGSYGSSTAIPTFTVNGKGLITAAGSVAVIAPAGTLTGTTLASYVVNSSLTSVGTLTNLTVGGTLTLNALGGSNTLLYNNYGTVSNATIASPVSFTGGVLSLNTVPVNKGGTGVTSFGGTNTILYTTSADTLASINSANNDVLITNSSGIPLFSNTLPTNVQTFINAPAAQLTGTTLASNVISSSLTSVGTLTNLTVGGTLTLNALGGSNTLLYNNYGTVSNATIASPVSFTGGVLSLNTVPVNKGGTGATTLTGLLKGNGTSPFTAAVGDADYQNPITLTTTGTSGAATFSGDTLNIPNYAGGVTSVTSSDSSLTISPTTGAVVAILNPAHANTFTALQQFKGNASTTQLTVSGNSYLGNTTLTNATSTSLYTNTLGINNQYFTSLTGAGLVDTGGVLSLSAAPFSGTYFAQGGNAYGTTAVLGTTDNNPLTFIVNNSEKARIDTSGHLGLGTTNPLYPLDINAAGQEALFGETGSNDYIGLANNNAYLGYDHFAGDTVLQGASGRGIEFAVNNSTFSLGVAATLTANGYFGIGTSSPANTLAVSGGASIGADYSTAAPTNGLIVEGNTGIGTTAPIAMLDVAGFINTDQYSGYEQGGQLLAYASSTNQDTIFGLGAGGQSATTSPSLNSITAIGYKALSSNITGYQDIAIGTQSLYSNTTGINNTAIGAQSIYSNTSGSSNTAIGTQTLAGNTTGSFNTAIGSHSLYSNATGANNTAIGNQALVLNTTGSSNTALGFYALLSNTTGANNTSLGFNGLYSNTTGNENTALGNQSGYGITTGSNNVLLGVSTSTASQNQITTGSKNISIGYDVAVASPTASNQLDIGNEIYGTGLNGTGATLSTGNIGIGTTTPGSLFSIGNTNGINFSTATSTFSSTGGISIANGCYAVNGVCIGTSLTGLSGTLSVSNGGTGATTLTGLLKGNGTSPFTAAIGDTDYQKPITLTTTGTSGAATFAGDTLNIPNYAGGVTSVSNADGSLTISPTTGAVVASLNPAHANTFTALQQFNNNASTTQLTVTGNTYLATAGGNVGIGTTVPTHLLTVSGADTNTTLTTTALDEIALVNTNNTVANNYSAVAFDTTDTNGASVTGAKITGIFDNHTPGAVSSDLAFITKNAGTNGERMRLTAAGNLGIGSTTPGSLLSIGNTNGINFSTATSTFNSTGGINLANGCYAVNGVCIGSGGGGGVTSVTNSDGTLTISPTTGAVIANLNLANADTWTATQTFNGSPTSALFAGNVGIGTSTPARALDIAGNGEMQSQILIEDNNPIVTANNHYYGIQVANGVFNINAINDNYSTSTAFTINQNNNVGIGTTSPLAEFTVGTSPGQTTTQPYTFLVSSTTAGTNTNYTELSVTPNLGASYPLGGVVNIASNLNCITTNSVCTFSLGATARINLVSTGITFSAPAVSGNLAQHFIFTGAPDSNILAGANSSVFVFNFSQTRTHASGVIAENDDVLLSPPTDSFSLGTAANSIISTSSSFTIQGEPGIGVRGSSINSIGLLIAPDTLNASTTNAYGLSVYAPVGATNNIAADFLGGNVGVGTTSPWRGLSVSGTVAIAGLTTETGISGSALCLSGTGSNEVVVNSGATSCTLSSEQYKHDIQSSNTGLAEVLAMNPVTFYYNGDTNNTNQEYGFVAEQVQQIDPRLVDINSSGTPQSVRYDEYTAVLTKAIQQLAGSYSITNVNGTASTSATVASAYAGAAAPAISVDASGNVGIGNSAPTSKLTVNGSITASSLEIPGAGQNFVSSYGSILLGSTTASSVLSTDGTGVDIYKLALFNTNGVQQLASQTASLSSQMNALTTRVSALEAGAAAATASLQEASSTSPSDFLTATTSALAGAMNTFGVLLQQGVAQFDTLVVRDLVFSKDSSGASAAGSGKVLAGNTTVEIDNTHMLASSQVSVTLTASMTGNWYVTNKRDGSFQVTLSGVQGSDVTFDYLIVQTQGQIATSTPDTAGSPFSWLVNFLGGPTATSTPPPSTPPADTGSESGTGSGGTASSTDSSGGTASSTSSTPSIGAPIVTLKGSAAISLNQGDAFIDPGASAVDASGTDITSSIVETGSVDTNTPGMYTLTYTATDSTGQSGNASRVVSVSASAPVIPPTPTPTPAPSAPSDPAAPSAPAAPDSSSASSDSSSASASAPSSP